MSSRRHRKWIAAALLAASAGLWGMAFAGPGLGIGRDDVSDCRGLGIMAGVAFIVWVTTGPRIRRNEQRLDAQDRIWAQWRNGQDAISGPPGGGLRAVSDRDVS